MKTTSMPSTSRTSGRVSTASIVSTWVTSIVSALACLTYSLSGVDQPERGGAGPGQAAPAARVVLDRAHRELGVGPAVDHRHLDAEGAGVEVAEDVLRERSRRPG